MLGGKSHCVFSFYNGQIISTKEILRQMTKYLFIEDFDYDKIKQYFDKDRDLGGLGDFFKRL